MTINKSTIIEFIEEPHTSAVELDFVSILNKSFFESKIYYSFSTTEAAFYKYSDSLKFWKKTKVEEVEKEVWIAYSKVIKTLSPVKSTLYEKSKPKSSLIFTMTFEKIRKMVKSYGMLCRQMPDSTTAEYIPLQNGYIDLKTLEFKPLDRHIFNRYVLPFNYSENYNEPDLFLKFIEQIQPKKEHQEFLLNWLSYMLVPSNPRQKALFMLGAGQNGKGVLTRIMTSLLGSKNTTSLTIPQISAETYHIATIVNSLVNFSPDNDPNDKLHVGTFKALSGGDIITVRNIHGAPFEMNFLGKLVFSVNKMPYFSSKDSAVLRRVEVLQFPVIISDKNKIVNLEDKILKNGGDEVFMYLLNRARSLAKNNFIFYAPDDIVEYSRLSIEENDSVFDFLETILQDIFKEEKLSYNGLYGDYKVHCMESNFKPLNKVSFKENLLMHSIKRNDVSIEFKRDKNGNFFLFTRSFSTPIPIEYETIRVNQDGILEKDGKKLF